MPLPFLNSIGKTNLEPRWDWKKTGWSKAPRGLWHFTAKKTCVCGVSLHSSIFSMASYHEWGMLWINNNSVCLHTHMLCSSMNQYMHIPNLSYTCISNRMMWVSNQANGNGPHNSYPFQILTITSISTCLAIFPFDGYNDICRQMVPFIFSLIQCPLVLL